MAASKLKSRGQPVVSLTERFDYAVMNHIVTNLTDYKDILGHNDLKQNELDSLQSSLGKYLASAKQDGTVQVDYFHVQDHGNGRLFAKGGISLQGMKKVVRNTVSHPHYYDIDMQNAHPTILLQVCEQHGIQTPRLHEYCANRAEVLKSLAGPLSTEVDAKTAMLVAINGGSLSEPSGTWLNAFEMEMRHVREALVPFAPKQLKLAQARAAKKSGDKPLNVLGSMVNLLLCEAENRALLKFKEFFEDRGLTVGVLVFDGCMVERSGNVEITESLLQEASEYVEGATGFRIKLAIKDMRETRLPVPEYLYNSHIPVEPCFAVDNATAAHFFVKDITSHIKACNGKTYAYLPDLLMWSAEPTRVQKYLLARCMGANIMRVRETKAGRSYVPMTGEISEALKVIKGALALLPEDTQFENKLWESSIGCICFKNGIYDFRQGCFQSYEERPDVMTTIVIPRDFPVSRPNPAVTRELMDRVFIGTLGSQEVVDYYLAFKARAIAGEFRDKQWAIMLGERNCGKGLLQELDKAAFPGYVNEVNANSFLLKQYADSDASKALSWALDCEFTRLTYTNELRCDHSSKNIKLDGNLLKSFQSGGDGISARKNHQDERVFRVATRLFMNMNSIPTVVPTDAMSTMVLFKFPYKFVGPDELAEKELPFYRLRDDGLKDIFCHRPDVWDAYIWLLMDAYQGHRPTMCPIVQSHTNEYLVDIGDKGTILDSMFQFTGRRQDFVTLARIKEIAQDVGIPKAAIKDRIERLGGRADRSCCVGGVVHGRGFVMVQECDLAASP